MDDPIRIMVVDDAAVVRAMLARVLDAEPDMEVVGSAADGRAAVARAEVLRPDVIVLDIEMPVMTGLEALPLLRDRVPDASVIVFSAFSRAGATVTLDALAAGAVCYATKPSNAETSVDATEQIRRELLDKIRALAAVRPPVPEAPAPAAPNPAPPTATRTSRRGPIDAIIIGCSTGGPAALEQVLPRLPANLDQPVLIVQHMPPTFTNVLAQRLDKLCPFPVDEATDGQAVEPGRAYIAAGGFHMRLRRSAGQVRLALDEGPKIKSCRPSVEALFDSAADVYGSHLVAAILTGMGDDGLDACRRLAEDDVEIVVQDEASSVVWGMPGAVAGAGLASRCVPLADVPNALLEAATRRAPARARSAQVVAP